MSGYTEHLITQANGNIAQLLRRFENIVALAPYTDHGNLTTTAIEIYQMEIEKAALIRGAENILVLTRALKEAWLFGKLDTVSSSEAAKETDKLAKEVMVELKRLTDIGPKSGTATGTVGAGLERRSD